ncbi:SRPBCC family protein [Fodinicola feengrottensis]|uniref:SRPBCC family protein n=1 Tax=Fodinicola feengrottensis TaxID=435914 RepID=A0ABP4UIF8_9ACTN|nr:SRPBCC family protein [Fodinicola feengrottensis]
MAEVTASTARVLDAPADRVFAAVRDYSGARQRILSEQFSEYEVQDGGTGAGTRVHWKLQATKSRVRDCLFEVSEPGSHQLVEKDANSSMVTTWTISPAGDRTEVKISTSWAGAGGVGGFFEKTFAPLGLRRIYDELLTNLDKEVRA